MPTRREVLYGGLGLLGLALCPRRGFALAPPEPCPIETGAPPWRHSRPLLSLPVQLKSSSTWINGVPFADWWTGDDFRDDYPFHRCENCFDLPAPTEEVDVAIVGGGISGLASAYLLREHRPVLFELRPRFGGNAMGETWGRLPYSLGSAYVITPDKGDELDTLYRELGLDKVVRVDEQEMTVEVGGAIISNFWKGLKPAEAEAFQRYADIVRHYAEDAYPDIPLPKGAKAAQVRELDRLSLRDDIEKRMGMPAPPLLAAAIQAYCYSSFGIGWQEISAASGWNFLAAEEYGRWVFPGGNAWLAERFWTKLKHLEAEGACDPVHLRASCRVVDVRLAKGGRVQVTYLDAAGRARGLLARQVVMANAKHIAKQMLPDLERIDPQRRIAMDAINNVAYLVANVLVHEPLKREFYDLFLLHDESFPMDGGAFSLTNPVVDVLAGDYAQPGGPTTVLTLYWPLPYHWARFRILTEEHWRGFAANLAGQLRERIFPLLGLSLESIEQVRLTRWGHAMPLAFPGLIAQGICETVRAPLEDRIYFISQDNWALPAVENSLLDALEFTGQISAVLRRK
jgi:hypothetical protein